MNWKKTLSFLGLIFIVSLASSTATWFVLTHHEKKQINWNQALALTPAQEKSFSALESEFNLALKDIARQDANDKIALCAYLDTDTTGQDLKSTTQRMAATYEKKQEKIAETLLSIANILTPAQKKLFSKRLMQEVCVSCKKATGENKCACGMCKTEPR